MASAAGKRDPSDAVMVIRRRVTDAEREAVAKLLVEAVAADQLDLTEYDVRVKAAYAANTRAELQLLVADLALEPGDKTEPTWGMPRSLVILWVVWAAVVVVNVTVWAMLTTAAGGGIHPWPAWVAIPPGVALLGATAVVTAARKIA